MAKTIQEQLEAERLRKREYRAKRKEAGGNKNWSEYIREYRKRMQVLVAEMKDVPCTDCGKKFPTYCMDFDHLPGEAKVQTVSKMMGKVGMKKILAEIAKCDVVCSNCHRIRTYDRGQWLPSQDEVV